MGEKWHHHLEMFQVVSFIVYGKHIAGMVSKAQIARLVLKN
jgi:hypothetical protein